MRKILRIALILVLIVGMTACGKTEAPENPYEKYEKLFRYMEDEDYDAAIEYIQKKAGKREKDGSAAPATEAPAAETAAPMPATEAAPAELPWESVEITMENWQDYFEYRGYPVFIKNGFGEFERLSLWLVLVSKDGIIPDCTQSNVTMEYRIRPRIYSISLDPENETFTLDAVGECTSDWRSGEVVTLTGMGENASDHSGSRYGRDIVTSITDKTENDQFSWYECEILRIAGTFVFRRAS